MIELTNEQRRQLIDVQQVYAARMGAKKLSRGHFRWGKRSSGEYLLRASSGRERSFGPRSPETEERMAAHERARLTYRTTGKRLEAMARVNKALRLNRVPLIAAKVLRVLDDANLLGESLFVIGTNALFAYEMKAASCLKATLLQLETSTCCGMPATG